MMSNFVIVGFLLKLIQSVFLCIHNMKCAFILSSDELACLFRSRNILDDFREAYFWLRQNTDENSR